MKKKFLVAMILFFFPYVIFAQSANVGIINGIWFSEDVFFAGDPIRIYTAIQNNSGDDIQGIIEFFDNDISIGKKKFTVLDRRISELWIDTIVSEGAHDYSVTITEAAINKPGQAVEPITPRVIKSDDTIFVDKDTDGDDIGDLEDFDDDNDGLTDIKEIELGTDPLEKTDNPKKSEENPNTDNEDDKDSIGLLQQLIQSLTSSSDENEATNNQNNNTSSSSENTNTDSVEKDQVPKNEILVPDYVEQLEKSYPIVTNITKPLNTIQNIIVPSAELERARVIDKIKPAAVEQKITVTDSETNIDERVGFNHGLTGWKYWLWAIYAFILLGIKWIFSCLLCMIILIFIGIHVLLKLLFRIFRWRDRIIS